MKTKVKISEEDRRQVKIVLDNFSTPWKSREQIFYDLCFAICSPQTTFKNNRKSIDGLIVNSFYDRDVPLEKLHNITRPTRFYRQKTERLLAMKEKFPLVLEEIERAADDELKQSDWILRDWLVKNIKGIGYKVASHFLRNVGNRTMAIIDVHILKFMGLDKLPTTTKNKYREIEFDFQAIACVNHLSPAELDAEFCKENGIILHRIKYSEDKEESIKKLRELLNSRFKSFS